MNLTPSDSRAGPAGQRTFAAFSNPAYLRLWTAGLMWYVARWMELVVLSWLVLQLTDSPGWVSLVGVCRMAPMFLLGLVAGSLADRLPKKRVMVAAQCLNLTAASFVLSMLLLDMVQPWHAYVAIFATGTAWTMDFSARRAYFAEIFSPVALNNAISLDITALMASSALGPLLGGSLISLLGFSGTYGVLLGLYATALPLLLSLRSTSVVKPPGERRGVGSQLLEAVRTIRGNRVVWTTLTVTIVLNFFGFPYIQMVPVIARDVLGVESVLYGVLFSAAGIGSMTGSLVIASRRIERKGTLYSLGATLMLGAIFLFALSPVYPLSFAILLVVGSGVAGFATMQVAMVLAAVPPEMRGRAVGAIALGIGASPMGTLLLGQLAEAFGAQTALMIMSGTGAMLMLVLRWRLPELRDKGIAPTPEATAGRGNLND